MAVDQGLINFPERRDDGSIIVKVGDHGGVNKQPINLGWMLESFLQHKGISYIVENGMIGRTYVFDPRNNSINYVDQSVMDKVEEIENGFNRWDLKN